MASLAEIRARLAAQENKQSTTTFVSDNAIYPHWNINEGATAILRFLPDADPKNDFFWVERQTIKLPFNGIKGGDNKQVVVSVPCVEMWNESCPILADVRLWFKDPSLEDMGRKYWKKRSYIFQGFVHQNPMAEENAPENPIRRFIISPQIFTLIKTSLMDPEMESLPTDYTSGLDFRVVKTSKGGYADYSTSSWARKETALTEAELAAINQHGLFDLKTFLPNKPNDLELKVMYEMFEASVNGEAYDVERWGSYYRPAGIANNATSDSEPATTASKPVVHNDIEEADTSTAVAKEPVVETAAASNKAEDILAMIRARQTS